MPSMPRWIATAALLALGSAAYADSCDQLEQASTTYNAVQSGTASGQSTRWLQQLLGITADGVWGRQSQSAYDAYVSRCGSYSYPRGATEMVNGGTVQHFYRNEVISDQTPYQRCETQQTPIYQTVQGKDDMGAVVGGALIGSVVGKVVTDNKGGTALGAILGGALANESQKKRNTTTQIVGYDNKQVCSTAYKTTTSTREVYSHSTITFMMDGMQITAEFTRP